MDLAELNKQVDEIPFGFLRAQSRLRYAKRWASNRWYQGDSLVHYTNLGGLLGIVQSGGVWLSDHRFLNDSAEYEDGRRLTIALLRRLASRRKSRFVNVLGHAADVLERQAEPRYFVCSFTTEPDSLEQWRAYAPGTQGVAVVFGYGSNRHGLGHFHMLPILLVEAVIYSQAEKLQRLCWKIGAYAREHRIDAAAGRVSRDGDWGESLARHLSVDFLLFKDPAYNTEREVRLIVSEVMLHHFPSGVHHRRSGARLIPYLRTSDLYEDETFVKWAGDRLPITEVKLSPTATDPATERSIRTFLRDSGYLDATVTRSSVPFRG